MATSDEDWSVGRAERVHKNIAIQRSNHPRRARMVNERSKAKIRMRGLASLDWVFGVETRRVREEGLGWWDIVRSFNTR